MPAYPHQLQSNGFAGQVVHLLMVTVRPSNAATFLEYESYVDCFLKQISHFCPRCYRYQPTEIV